MYYSPELLSKRRGKFGVVWLASKYAGRDKNRLSRRDYQSVNLNATCEELERLVYPSPALALRLSSVLFLGVLRVYEKQLLYLFGDVRQLWVKVQRHTEVGDASIDLPARAGGLDPFDPLNPFYLEALSEWKLFVGGRMTEGVYYRQLMAQQAAYHTAPVNGKTSDDFLEASQTLDDLPGMASFGDAMLSALEDGNDFGPVRDPTPAKVEPWNDMSPRLLPDEPEMLSPLDDPIPPDGAVPDAEIPDADMPDADMPDFIMPTVTSEEFSEAVGEGTTITFSLNPLETNNRKKKRRGPIVNEKVAFSYPEMQYYHKHTEKLIKPLEFSAVLEKATASDLFTRPAGFSPTNCGRDFLQFYRSCLVPPPAGQRRADWSFDRPNEDENLVVVDFPDDMMGYDETGDSIEVARHGGMRDDDGVVSLGASGLTMRASHSNMSLDTVHGSFPTVEHGSLDNLSALSAQDRDRDSTGPPLDPPFRLQPRSTPLSRASRFSIQNPLQQIQEENDDEDMSSFIHSGVERFKSISAFVDLHAVLQEAMGDRNKMAFSRLMSPGHAPRKTAAVAFYHLLDMSSKNIVDLKQAPNHNIIIEKGADF